MNIFFRTRGQRLWETHKGVAFRVSLDTYERALSLVNTLALAADGRGFTVSENRDIGRIVFSGYDADVQMGVTEVLEDKSRPRIRYDGKSEHESYKLPTGRLRFTLQAGYREGPIFEDRDTGKLETRLNDVFAGRAHSC